MKKKEDASEQSGAFRNIFALGFVSFFTDVSSEMVFSLLPTFILGLQGSSRALLGIIEGVAEALSYSMRAVSGIFSDKFKKRKALILIGYGFSNAVKPLFAVAQTAFDALTVRVADRVGKAIRTSPRDALLSESVSEKQRGTAFGLHRTLDQTGAIVGPILASLMLVLGLTVRDIFWVSLAPGFVAVLILAFFVKEKVGKPSGEFRFLRGVRSVLGRDFILLLLVVSVFSLGAFDFSFVLVNAEEAGLPDPLLPIVYAVVNVAHVAVAIPSGMLSDRIGKEKTLMIGYGAFLVMTLLLFAVPRSLPYAYIIGLVFGAYLGIVNTVQRAMIPRYAESGLRGTAYGLYYLTVGMAFLVANTAVGILWDHAGPSAAASYSAVLTTVAIIGMLLFIIREGRIVSHGERKP